MSNEKWKSGDWTRRMDEWYNQQNQEVIAAYPLHICPHGKHFYITNGRKRVIHPCDKCLIEIVHREGGGDE